MARMCIFCGAAANSREDVWPCWLTSRFIAPGTMGCETPTFCRAPATRVLGVRKMIRGRGFAPNVRAAYEWMRGIVTKGWVS